MKYNTCFIKLKILNVVLKYVIDYRKRFLGVLWF